MYSGTPPCSSLTSGDHLAVALQAKNPPVNQLWLLVNLDISYPIRIQYR